MKVSFDVSCVQLAMRHCHNAENGGNNRDGGSKQCAFPGRIRRSPRNERGFVAGSLSAVCARGHLRRGRRVEEFWKFLGRGLGHRSRLRCRFSRGGQRRQVPLGVSMTMMGYFRRCHGRSSFARGGSLVLDLLVERLRDRAQAGPTQCLDRASALSRQGRAQGQMH